MPELILVGGPNGAGKSTFIREILRRESLRYLCADEAAFELCPEAPETVAVAAGRLFLRRVVEARDDREDVVIESTLSGKSFARQVEAFATAGYRIRTIFVTPFSPDAAVRRVSLRVSKGGHPVPEPDILRRFCRAHRNFWFHYRALSERWVLYHNETANGPARVAFGARDRMVITDSGCFDRFLEICYSVE